MTKSNNHILVQHTFIARMSLAIPSIVSFCSSNNISKDILRLGYGISVGISAPLSISQYTSVGIFAPPMIDAMGHLSNNTSIHIEFT
jgi:hypothetical protein